jgi:transcription elongation factor Elf1
MVDNRKYSDRRKYMIEAVSKRRKKIREMAIEYKGGKCFFCGYNKCPQALEFHHNESNEKDFGISAKGYTRSWDRVKKELDKCTLVCANCHREVHSGIRSFSK